MLPHTCRAAVKRAFARISPVLVTAFFLLALAACTASAATTVISAPAESFSLPSGGAVFSDSTAEGGHGLLIYSNATATKSVSLPSATDGITIRVRGDQCNGAPNLKLVVDGSTVGNYAISSTTYTTVTATRSLGAGTHTVAVAFTNDSLVKGVCDRNLRVDTASFTSDSTSTATTSTYTPSKLRWAPPTLTAPTTIQVAEGDRSFTLDTTKDYILQLPSTPHMGYLTINGGHNVILKGGQIGLPLLDTAAAALTIKNNVGTVHVEGVLFDGSSGEEMDGIQIIAPESIVQVENVRATGLLGSYTTNHSDVIQPWGGVKALRVDHLSGDTNYQGIFTRPDQGPIGSVTLQNVDLAYDNVGALTGGFMLWMTTGCTMAPTTLSNFYIDPRSTLSLGTSVWPAVTDSKCPATVSGDTVNWSKTNLPITGSVTLGQPTNGPYVPAGVAGTSYTSPGYQ